MNRLGNILTAIIDWIKAPLAVTATSWSYTMTANGAHSVNQTVTKEGYYPLAICGWETTGNYTGWCVTNNLKLADQQSGSARIVGYITNRGNNGATWTTMVQVLWRKEV